MANLISGSQTETYATVETTVEATVVPRTVTQSEQIARYFTEDLLQFVHDTNINLASELQIPSDYPQNTEEVIWMLFDDLSHMLRDRLITGVHLLLSEPDRDPNTHAYPLR